MIEGPFYKDLPRHAACTRDHRVSALGATWRIRESWLAFVRPSRGKSRYAWEVG